MNEEIDCADVTNVCTLYGTTMPPRNFDTRVQLAFMGINSADFNMANAQTFHAPALGAKTCVRYVNCATAKNEESGCDEAAKSALPQWRTLDGATVKGVRSTTYLARRCDSARMD